MALPVGWPPRPASSNRSIRFYTSGTTTANFSDNAFLFINGNGANTYAATPYVPPGAETQTVHLGTPTTMSGSPMGAGQDPHDAFQGTAPPQPMIWSNGFRIYNDGTNDLQFSFDGTNVQGYVKAGQLAEYYFRHEAGIAVRQVTAGSAFRIEAW